jgi:hypothetical protein
MAVAVVSARTATSFAQAPAVKVDKSVRLPAFRDVARSAGIDFVHISGASEQRFFPEIVGSGGRWLTRPSPVARATACTETAALRQAQGRHSGLKM